MKTSSWSEILRQTALYLRLRNEKGYSTYDFISQGVRFGARRWLSNKRTTVRSPLIATIAITSRCPLNCYHCSEGYKGSYELPGDAVRAAIDDLVDLGAPVIALTGGEPFSRADFRSLLDRIPRSVAAVIYTSGIGLTEDLARDLARRSNLSICFSLDHSDPAEHDRRRRRPGAYDSVMRGIELMAGGKADVHVSTLVTRDRLASGELPGFARDLKARGVMCLQIFQPRPIGRLTSDLDLYLRPEEEEQLFSLARALNHDGAAPIVVAYPAVEHASAFGCCAGYARVYVDSHGNVCPCDFAPLSFGNITSERMAEIWSRMRDFFAAPGRRCLVRDNPDAFGGPREERNVDFASLADPASLHSEAPGAFVRFGERGYRMLLSNFLLAAIAAAQWGPHDE